MEDRNNCGACYFYDKINHKERTIYCILWQKRRSQYDPCVEWTKHENDPLQVKEMRAQSIREKYQKQEQDKVAKERHKETIELAKKGFRVTKRWAIIGIIIAAMVAVAIYLFFK